MRRCFSLRTTLSAALVVAAATAYDNNAPHSRLPVLGWSSWVALGPSDEHPIFDYCDEFSVMSAIDAFVAPGMFKDAGYRHFHLDDCWAGGRYANGSVYPEADHFPNGMKHVVDYAHSKGLAFGLYTCGGTQTCVGGRPGSKDHWAADADSYASWGVDWVKMDWCVRDQRARLSKCPHHSTLSKCVCRFTAFPHRSPPPQVQLRAARPKDDVPDHVVGDEQIGACDSFQHVRMGERRPVGMGRCSRPVMAHVR